MRRAVIALMLVTILWGLSFPLVKASNLLLAKNLETATGEAIGAANDKFAVATAGIIARFVLAVTLLLLCWPDRFYRLTAAQWLMGGIVGVLYAAGLLLQAVGLIDIPASRSGFLTSLSVVFTPLLLVGLTWRRPGLGALLAVLCALAGTAFLTQILQIDMDRGISLSPDCFANVGMGDLLTTLCAAVFALEIILLDVFSKRMPPELLTPPMIVATLLVGCGALAFHVLTGSESAAASAWMSALGDGGFWTLTLILTIACTIVPIHVMNKCQPRVAPTHAAIIYTLEPVFTTLWALFLPGLISPMLGINYPSEVPGWELIVGGGLIVAANLMGFEKRQESGQTSITT